MKRKIIGCIINDSESDYQQRLLDGLIRQSEKYGYNLAVFSPLIDISHYDKVYMNGEFNILKLINYDLIDALVVAAEPLQRNDNNIFHDTEAEILKKCKKPVITLDVAMGNFEMICTDDKSAFTSITSHVLDVHKCKNIYFLSGPSGFNISEMRIDGFREELNRRGLTVNEDNIFYGDFWYTGGAELGDRIVCGELDIPDAVICANDHMAIGLQRRLEQAGIKVPDQVIIMGYDATQDAALNDVTITSFMPHTSQMAQKAINRIRELIDPGMPVEPIEEFSEKSFCMGMSCGCPYDVRYTIHNIEASIIRKKRDSNREDICDNMDYGHFIESYMLEHLTATKSPDECLSKISGMTYLFNPYSHFYMCLKDNWLDTEQKLTDGYPETMRTVVHSVPDYDIDKYNMDDLYAHDCSMHRFDTSLMLPQLHNENDEPYVFYFVPLHFQNDTLGYGVLQCDMPRRIKVTFVFRNWIRNVNNALEMTRVQNKIMSFALYDNMTGLYNRRGMDTRLRELKYKSPRNSICAVCVIDMDGLKVINDTYGHSDGDFGIMMTASAVSLITDPDEIAIRAGGDEFYIIGIGKYTEDQLIGKEKRLGQILEDKSIAANRPYNISASIGHYMKPLMEFDEIQEIINIADEHMYKNKIARKKERK